jgi:3',5'-cyclic AMP phosphodiesterase CpdA
MSQFSRRDFLKVTAASLPLCLGWDVQAGAPPQTLSIGVCADPHQDVMHDAEARLRSFIEVANRERLDFVVQLGDFCRPYEKNRQFLGIWKGFSGPRYHTLGNHDNDGGFTWQQVQDFWKLPRRYYSFDQAGWHFVVLDGNEIKPGKRAPGYPRYIGAKQQAWLREDLQRTEAPTIIFSHQSLEDPEGIENLQEIRGILELANTAAGWRKVGACLSGHHHIDFATQIAGIHYVQVNSMSYQWLGEQYQHARYGAEIEQAHPSIKYTAPYREALFAVLTLSASGLKITGRRSEFVGPSPWDLGLPEVKGTARDRERMVPWISDRQLTLQTRGA